jgi:hypothetical protein
MTAARRTAAGAAALLAALAGAGPARAHELTPSLLSIVQRAPDRYDVVWRVPIDEAPRGLMVPVLPEGEETAHALSVDTQARYESWSLRIAGGLAGRALRLDGPASATSDGLVRVQLLDGRVVHGRLAPGGPPFVVPAAPSRLQTAAAYLRLGVEHILLGFDHLLFVLGLLLLVRSLGALVRTITAFTAAHSVTLALAALGVLHVPGPPVEATIALSILFVAREIIVAATPGAPPSLAARAPWAVALAFGLLHGLGFAGALAQVGLPAREVPLALATFNVGVEIGQLAFVAAIALLGAAAAAAGGLRAGGARLARMAAGYGIGVLAAALCIGRIAVFWRR